MQQNRKKYGEFCGNRHCWVSLFILIFLNWNKLFSLTFVFSFVPIEGYRSVEKYTITTKSSDKHGICSSRTAKPTTIGTVVDAKPPRPWQFGRHVAARTDRTHTGIPTSSTGFTAATTTELHGTVAQQCQYAGPTEKRKRCKCTNPSDRTIFPGLYNANTSLIQMNFGRETVFK